jgi:hypothetical protein
MRRSEKDVLIVSSGKCNNAREFEAFAAVLNSVTMTYSRDDEIDLDEWKENMGVKSKPKVKVPPSVIAEIVAQGITKPDLRRALVKKGVSRSQAYKLIDNAEDVELIVVRDLDKHYIAPTSSETEPF